MLDDFIGRFGNVPIYGALARTRREEVAKLAMAATTPPIPPPPPRSDGPLKERGLKPKDNVPESCPEMVVVPAGSFAMGSPESEIGRDNDASLQHVVTISKPFAVGKLHLMLDQFAALSGRRGIRRVLSASPSKVALGRNARIARGAIPVLPRRVRIPRSSSPPSPRVTLPG